MIYFSFKFPLDIFVSASLTTDYHWFRQWLGTWQHKAINWTSDDQVLYCHCIVTRPHIGNCTVHVLFLVSSQLDINTVAAGGGSQLFFRAGMFVVGPESAGAHPGPVCYKKGLCMMMIPHEIHVCVTVGRSHCQVDFKSRLESLFVNIDCLVTYSQKPSDANTVECPLVWSIITWYSTHHCRD